MKEYRIIAYFTDNAPRGYQPRSYKRKIVTTYDEAMKLYNEAIVYYGKYKYFDKVVIESREVTEWKGEYNGQ